MDAGVASPTTAPTVPLPGKTGNNIRYAVAVEEAQAKFDTARRYGRSLPDEELVVAETISGGTTTAMAVLTALGEQSKGSSSLLENPLGFRRTVVADALNASNLSKGSAAGKPIEAVQSVGDPVLTGLAGLTVGALESGTSVTLGGGTQTSAIAALVRHFGVDDSFLQSTTVFIANDESAGVQTLADTLNLSLTIADPQFDACDHPAMEAYLRGEAKEGVGMGGALALIAEAPDIDMSALHDRIATVYNRLLADIPDGHPAAEHAGSVAE